jgi:purine-binding chemotaxis protein CheW
MATKVASQPAQSAPVAVHEQGERKPGTIQVVEFLLGNERFAIDLFDVRGVVEYTSITKLPNVPSCVRGIINLRGVITTIIDLKHRLNITDGCNVPVESSRIIVLDDRITPSKIGILVDDVTSVSTFEADRVDTTSASFRNEDTAIIGIIKRKVKVKEKDVSELIIWIDIKQLVTDIDICS